jgi:hypothetical protein
MTNHRQVTNFPFERKYQPNSRNFELLKIFDIINARCDKNCIMARFFLNVPADHSPLTSILFFISAGPEIFSCVAQNFLSMLLAFILIVVTSHRVVICLNYILGVVYHATPVLFEMAARIRYQKTE